MSNLPNDDKRAVRFRPRPLIPNDHRLGRDEGLEYKHPATFGSLALGMQTNAPCMDGGTSYHIIVLHPMEIKVLNSLDPLNDARDRRGSGCEWSRLNVVSHYHGFDPFDRAHFSERHNLKSNQSYGLESRFFSWH